MQPAARTAKRLSLRRVLRSLLGEVLRQVSFLVGVALLRSGSLVVLRPRDQRQLARFVRRLVALRTGLSSLRVSHVLVELNSTLYSRTLIG